MTEFRTHALRSLAEGIGTTIVLSCVPVTIKYISANSFTIAIARLAIAVICLCIYIRARHGFKRVNFRDMAVCFALGLFFALHWLTYFLSIKVSSASISAISLSTYGIHLIVLGWIFQKTRVSSADVLAVLLAILGSALVVPEFSLKNDVTLGIVLGVISGLSYAFLPIIQQRSPDISTSTKALGQFVVALLFFLFLWPLSDWHFPAAEWLALIFLGVICTFVGHTMWVRVTTKLSTVTTSIISYLYVPSAMLLSCMILDEHISLPMILGAALIIGGNLLALCSQWKRTAILSGTQL